MIHQWRRDLSACLRPTVHIVSTAFYRAMLRRTRLCHAKSLSTLATKVAENGNKSRCFVARNGDFLSAFRATFVAVFGDYSFGYNLSPFSATFVASVDRL